MSTTSLSPDVAARPYFRHDQQFKDRVIASYRQSRQTISAIARSHGIRPDLLQRWISDAGVRDDHGTDDAQMTTCGASVQEHHGATTFLPISIEPGTRQTAPSICIELSIAGTQVTVHWPASEASSCAAWLREVLL